MRESSVQQTGLWKRSDENAQQEVRIMGSDEKGFIGSRPSVSDSMDTEERYNKLLVEDSFNDTLEELKKLRIRVPKDSSQVIPDLESFYFPPEGELVSAVDKIEKVRLDPEAGARWAEDRLIAAYDESIRKFSAIEGTAYFTAHSLVLLKTDTYLSPLSHSISIQGLAT